MASFYDDPKTGETRFRAIAGGHGGGITSEVDIVATPEKIEKFPREYNAYLAAKAAANPKTKPAPVEDAAQASAGVVGPSI